MAYYVYENLVRNKAIVHQGNCSWCNYGKGPDNGKQPNAKHIWHGDFAIRDDAIRFAERTGRKDVRECQHCAGKTE